MKSLKTFKKLVKKALGNKIVFGTCLVALAGGTFFGSYELTSAILKPKIEYNFGDLPMTKNNQGIKIYNKNRVSNIYLTEQFAEEFFKDTTIEEQTVAMNGLMYGMHQFNSLTDYYKFTISSETDAFMAFGIEKDTSRENNIPINIHDDPTIKEAAATNITALSNGSITDASMYYTKHAVFGIWDYYTDQEQLLAGENSIFATVFMHESMHIIGHLDIYSKNQIRSIENILSSYIDHDNPDIINSGTIMYYSLTPKYKTYTTYDREYAKLTASIVAKEYQIPLNNKTSNTQYVDLTSNIKLKDEDERNM